MTATNCSSLNATSETVVGNPTATTLGALILTIVFLLGFPGNLFVIWSILARARKQSVTTLLIINLAIADGSLMALTPFFIVYLVLMKWVIGNVMCKILFYLCLANMYASIHLIMLMSIYRMVAILWPRQINVITGKRTIMRVLAVVWGLVMITSIPALIFREVTCKKSSPDLACELHLENTSQVVLYYTLELVLGFLIPYGVILVCYICILRRIKQTKFHRQIRSEKLILAIVLIFCLFWLPYHLISMVKVAWALSPDGTVKQTLDPIWRRSRAVTSTIAFISSCANPVLYFFAGKSYIRREGLAFMARLFETAGIDSFRKSQNNSQNSRDRDKDADVVKLNDKDLEDLDSVANSSSNVKQVKNGK
ncbi:leukotriene B4 receptor 2a [Kryptolebias marmoratus]|uniref:Leukotriene B4 receptor 2a n=1 Tax=Kryptolebias marmoratus TaxID=37003 RepID=A0A3Q3FT35_KRYMA|nr:leukotriene B4 receptor 2a [Kryptolebias marmoratus]